MASTTFWLTALAVGIFLIELMKGRHRGIHRPQDAWIIVTSIAGGTLLRPVLALVTGTAISVLMPAYQGILAGTPFVPALIAIFLIAEFFQYIIHRAAHNSKRHKFLYGMHRTHHSAPYVNVTLTYRSNLFWAFVHSYTWVMAVAFYLGLAGPALAFFVIMMAWNALTHSDWRWDDAVIAHIPYGRRIIDALEWLVITPRIHHTHHGFGKDGQAYRNFCTVLSIYDRMFGTLHIPEGRPYRYGLPGGEHHWLRQILFPLLPLGEAKRRRPSPATESETLSVGRDI